MDQRDERSEGLPPRPPAEGVRIIGAEEAQAALDAGQASGRRPDDEPRFGDVPAAPSGPRPAHRFPLPDSVDPAGVPPLPAVVAPVEAEERSGGVRRVKPRESPDPSTITVGPPARPEVAPPMGVRWPDPDPGENETDELLRLEVTDAELGGSHEIPSHAEPRAVTADPADQPTSFGSADQPISVGPADQPISVGPADQPISVGSADQQLPHWTDPPTGEVPRILGDQVPSPGTGPDDNTPWQALGSRGLRWRDDAADWGDVDEMGALGDDAPRVGALDSSRTEHSDLFSFDDEFDRLDQERSGVGAGHLPELESEEEPETVAIRTGVANGGGSQRARSAMPAGRPRRPTGSGSFRARNDDTRNLGVAVGVGAALLALTAVCYLVGVKALLVLTVVVIVGCASELFGLLRRAGLHVAGPLGIVAAGGVVVGAYFRGVGALPLVTVILGMASMCWYALGVEEGRAVRDGGATVLGFAWVGLLGSYAALLLKAHDGKHLFLAAVVPTIAADMVAYMAGSQFGSHQMAPRVSPGKTWEGTISGGVAAVVVAVLLIGHLAPFDHVDGLKLGIMIAIVAPLGDLCESVVKRDLHVKDSGGLLPGHGGLLDRFDSLLFVLPATYYLSAYLHL